jgi:hypothetical protein
LLRSIESLGNLFKQEGKIMENQIDSISSLTNQELVTLFIVIGFRDMVARLLYQHATEGTDV